MKNAGAAEIGIIKYADGEINFINDQVVIEAPLRILISVENENGKLVKPLAITLRTPGQDAELAIGYLFSEGIINKDDTIKSLAHSSSDPDSIIIGLEGNIEKLNAIAQRNNSIYSSCGVCGKTEFEPFECTDIPPVIDGEPLEAGMILSLPAKMAPFQKLFSKTGGIHGAGIFDKNGNVEVVMEDIGRHNAVDKVIGYYWLKNIFSLQEKILVLSGRAGYELIQKAAIAGIRTIVSVGAPSSMSIETAIASGITLVGFVKNNQFNVYTHPQQIKK